MKITKTFRIHVRDDYLDLVRQFPLRPLRDDREQQQAVYVLSGLVGRVHGRLSPGEREYADALGCFIRQYDDRVFPLPRHKSTPLELVQSLMEDHAMSSTDLGRVLGSATAASLFLAGKRELSKNHIRRLSGHFKIDAGVFL
jgi:HTH-type transcriptional regulator / antitoxin HigA